MVQARPIPGYLPSSGPAEGGSVGQDDLPNGQHLEEINLEARRRHREEKLPPLAKNSSQDLEDRAEADSHPTQNNQEDDAEKILTIEQVEEQENETKENEKNSKKGTLRNASKASEASFAPQASHQPPMAASVRV